MIPILQLRKHGQAEDYIDCLQLTVEQGCELAVWLKVMLYSLCYAASCSYAMKCISQLHSSLFSMSPKDLTGEPLYNLLNQIQINQEVKRDITPGHK